ncbi:hypothetical protein L204_105778 [Cryptococcus depauperatus]|nr:AMP-binding protein [Cryptococcus depauperatus CBS 7855]
MDQVYTSSLPVPELPKTLIFDYLFPRTKRYNYYPAPVANPDGTKKAFIDGLSGRAVTRDEVEEQALALADGLKKIGIMAGDVVCILGMNSLEWVNALLGCQALGAIASPANYAYTPTELLHQLRDSTSESIFIQPNLVHVLLRALELDSSYNLPESRIFLLCPSDAKPSKLNHLKCNEDLWELGRKVDGRMSWQDGDETKTAYLCYSSGTTGKAKGVETSHYNMTSQIQAVYCSYEPMTDNDVVLGVLPFSHIYGLTMNIHYSIAVNGTMVILARFEELSVLKAVEKYKITWSLVVPPMILALLHSPNMQKYNISSLRGFQSGAAPLSSNLIEAFQKKYPRIGITQGYGLTETTPVINVMTLDEGKGHKGCIGKLIPTYQARLIELETGRDAAKGERGEFWVKGPSVMKGYWRNKEATVNTFEDGWFKTGDVAVVDDEGFFSIVDRVKELVKYKGFQVPPAELEALLLKHSAVADVGVIGIYSEAQATELPRAYIVPRGGLSSLSSQAQRELSKDIHDWAASQVANHKKLRGGVILIDAIPKSPSGKILRKDLRALAKKEAQDAVAAGREAKL